MGESKAGPRIILWDLENSHNLAAVFQLKHNDYINAENIFRERFVICGSWKELGKAAVHSVSVLDDPKRFKANPFDDKYVITKLHEILSSADVLIAHNGDEFDSKMARGRMLVHGLPPLPPVLSIDTLKTARKQFLLNANNLNYLGHILGVGSKKPTKQGLWLKVLRGDQQAIQDMVAYNKQDVRLLERVFMKLQPHIPDHVNRQLFTGDGTGCPRCGSKNIQSRGTHKATTQSYRRWQCQDCYRDGRGGGWFRDRKAIKGTSTQFRVL